MADCDTPMDKVMVKSLALGGSAGTVTWVNVENGPCFSSGDHVTLLRPKGTGVDVILDEDAVLVPKTTRHLGGIDLGLGVPGMTQPVMQWNGRTYVVWKNVTN